MGYKPCGIDGKDVIKEPFCVINCDDFYNRDCFKVIGKFLADLPEGARDKYAMVGFRVGNTLSENGTVARGICSTDAEGNLTTVVERTEIERRDGEIKYKDDNGEWVAVGENTPVSMNVWGLHTPTTSSTARHTSRSSSLILRTWRTRSLSISSH